jgi:tetratricopeptide (TPR) repeat protein
LQAQTEIADTYYLQGKYAEASDYLARLLKLESTELNKPQILYKLVRSLYYQERLVEVVAQAQFFLKNHTNSVELPEVRFLLADTLKKQGHTREAMQQVLLLLQAQEQASRRNPENWIYWQQRTGNEIANQLYKEGDYVNALEIYLNLSPLDTSAMWQLPVWYQVGLIYERLQQSQKAVETYTRIIAREQEVTTAGAPSPSLVAVLDMAKWRKAQLAWQVKAESIRQQLNPVTALPLKTADATP